MVEIHGSADYITFAGFTGTKRWMEIAELSNGGGLGHMYVDSI
jgi:hypothetical protein